MRTKLEIPRFVADERSPEYLSRGQDGFVYSLGDGLVAKVPGRPQNWAGAGHYQYIADSLAMRAANECDVAEKLYTGNISVPKPEGVFLLDVPDWSGKIFSSVPAFVMEHVKGERIDKIRNKKIKRRAEALRNSELAKAEILALPSTDARTNCNALYDPNDNRVTLLDFVGWGLRA